MTLWLVFVLACHKHVVCMTREGLAEFRDFLDAEPAIAVVIELPPPGPSVFSRASLTNECSQSFVGRFVPVAWFESSVVGRHECFLETEPVARKPTLGFAVSYWNMGRKPTGRK